MQNNHVIEAEMFLQQLQDKKDANKMIMWFFDDHNYPENYDEDDDKTFSNKNW